MFKVVGVLNKKDLLAKGWTMLHDYSSHSLYDNLYIKNGSHCFNDNPNSCCQECSELEMVYKQLTNFA